MTNFDKVGQHFVNQINHNIQSKKHTESIDNEVMFLTVELGYNYSPNDWGGLITIYFKNITNTGMQHIGFFNHLNFTKIREISGSLLTVYSKVGRSKLFNYYCKSYQFRLPQECLPNIETKLFQDMKLLKIDEVILPNKKRNNIVIPRQVFTYIHEDIEQ